MVKLGYLSKHNPLNRSSFSGTSYYMYRAIAENNGCSVRLLGKHRRPRRFLGKVYQPASDTASIAPASFEGLNVVLSLASSSLVPQYASLTDVPIVHCTDATPGFLNEFYQRDIPRDRIEELFESERRAYDNAQLVLFSSDFMRQYAIAEFGRSYAPKLEALPWGANLDDFPESPPPKPPLSPLRLLFIGKQWARKGGHIAVETLEELRRRGVAAELHLVGVKPGQAPVRDGVIDHGFLNKNIDSQRAMLGDIMNRSHFLIMPTRADCTPMVVAEANSRAIPVLITNVGGIPSLMQPGRNGEMLPLGATASDYADRLMGLSEDRARYDTLSRTSFAHFKDHLTWEAWGDSTISLLKDRFGAREAASA